ncbi:protein diaphanous homolog 1-like [Pocillopora damicornis]|uniref:protein diaphanous homolog 1-like n=1 Tax=Pocillopora damicornis TaxID=46731 RepID=UPI000F555710|nr:protein diaphanous homolog 1-like [Pocillopora damicornis]
MTRATLLLCFTLFVLTHAAPEPSKRGCCAPGPECDNPCPDQQDSAPDPQEQAPPMAGYAPAADGQQFMPGPEEQQQFMPAPDQQAPQMDQPMDQQQNDCCQPGPTCFNPCAPPPPPPPSFLAPPPPPPVAGACCQPGPTCDNPCAIPPPMPDMGMAGCCDPSVMPMCANPCPPQHPPRTAYAPYPGEITMKLKQPWKSEFTDHASAAYQILAGNLATAIKTALRREAFVNNIYFREGYVPGNPSTQPITVAHFMVDGGSDDASLLQQQVTPDESLGDGLKVYKDSFNAY